VQPRIDTPFTRQLGIDVPLICGAMYPCSNPELIAAVSEAGGIGVIQPISMEFVHRRPLREGIRELRRATRKPLGFNAIVEQSSKAYEARMRAWIDVALDEGIEFFVTALGNPRWVVDLVHQRGGVVYHDVTERKWAMKAIDAGVDGLICVNRRAGGHAGSKDAATLISELGDLGVPLVCAGGIGDEAGFVDALREGWAGVQMGTRFIATTECTAHEEYKRAIVRAEESDIVLTEKLSGVPVAVIKTPYIEQVGTKAGPVARWLLRHPKGKHWMRTIYSLTALWQLREASRRGSAYKDYWQAGKSVAGIDAVESAATIVERFAAAAIEAGLATPDQAKMPRTIV
jgi:nitronate monooxygenase